MQYLNAFIIFCSNQDQLLKNTRSNTLSIDTMQDESLEINRKRKATTDANWIVEIQKLKVIKAKCGHLKLNGVSVFFNSKVWRILWMILLTRIVTWQEADKKMYQWLYRQKIKHRRRRLEKYQLDYLHELGVDWALKKRGPKKDDTVSGMLILGYVSDSFF
jgi:hypothetical protein